MSATNNYQELIEILSSIGFAYDEVKDVEEKSVVIPFRGEDFSTDLFISVDDAFYMMECKYQVSIPVDKRQKVTTYISMINLRIKAGKFLIDLNSGEVFFRVAGLFPTVNDQVDTLISLTLSMIDGQLKPIMSIAYGEKEPEEVLKEFFMVSPEEETVKVEY